jgi:hypothetical protein
MKRGIRPASLVALRLVHKAEIVICQDGMFAPRLCVAVPGCKKMVPQAEVPADQHL